jgi:hypothetical protein
LGEIFMIDIGMMTVSPFDILSVRAQLAPGKKRERTWTVLIYIYSPNLVVEDPIAAHERLGEWYDIGLSGHPDGAVHHRVQPECFADDGVEVLERVEIVHRRRVVRERSEFFAELGLDFGVAGEGEERPYGRRRSRFVALKIAYRYR